MNRLIICGFFSLGTLFGSFGSVLLLRLNDSSFTISKSTLKGILRGRSQCPHCHQTLKPQHLVPLLSFILQKGKCGHCHAKISPFYPIVEIVSGLLFVLSFNITGTIDMTLRNRAIILRLLGLLAIRDIKTTNLHLPIWMILNIIIITHLLFFDNAGLFHLWGGLLSGGIFSLIYMGGKRYATRKYGKPTEGFGLGDVLLACSLGVLLPYTIYYDQITILTLSQSILYFITLSNILGVIFAGLSRIYHTRGKKKKNVSITHIPFFPAMIVGFIILLLLANHLS